MTTPGPAPGQPLAGERIPLAPQRLEELARDRGRILLLPPGIPGGARREGRGLEGLLAARVEVDRVRREGRGERGYGLRVVLAPGAEPVPVKPGATLVLETGWDRGPAALRVHFWRETVPERRRLGFPLWLARLGEGLAFTAPGGGKWVILDGDGDGWFSSYGVDLLVPLEGTPERPVLPLSRHLLYATGGFALRVDAFDRIAMKGIERTLGLLRIVASFAESVDPAELVVGAGETFRAVPPGVEAVPVTAGTWRVRRGRLEEGLLFALPAPAEGKEKSGGVRIGPGGEGELRLGAPFKIRPEVKDWGGRIKVRSLRITGTAGEIYGPDLRRAAGVKPLRLMARLVEGSGRGKQRALKAWIPWRLDSRGRLERATLLMESSPHWDPLFLELTVTAGPLKGAGSKTRIR